MPPRKTIKPPTTEGNILNGSAEILTESAEILVGRLPPDTKEVLCANAVVIDAKQAGARLDFVSPRPWGKGDVEKAMEQARVDIAGAEASAHHHRERLNSLIGLHNRL